MTHDPDRNITMSFPDVTDVIDGLMRDFSATGTGMWRTNEDGTWTRIKPEDYHSRAPSEPSKKVVSA